MSRTRVSYSTRTRFCVSVKRKPFVGLKLTCILRFVAGRVLWCGGGLLSLVVPASEWVHSFIRGQYIPDIVATFKGSGVRPNLLLFVLGRVITPITNEYKLKVFFITCYCEITQR